MIKKLIPGFFFITVVFTGSSIEQFRIQLAHDIQLYMTPPPESSAGDTCFHYAQLLKIGINKFSKVESMELSDNASVWFKNELIEVSKRGKAFKKLDSLALKGKIRNAILIFPIIIESDDFPCGKGQIKRDLSLNLFEFNGKKLKGNIIFGDEIALIWSTRYLFKK